MLNVDWKLLNEQKIALVSFLIEDEIPSKEIITGIINFIDSIQDQEADKHPEKEMEIFDFEE